MKPRLQLRLYPHRQLLRRESVGDRGGATLLVADLDQEEVLGPRPERGDEGNAVLQLSD